MTNKGLNISLMLILASKASKKGILVPHIGRWHMVFDDFIAPLNCYTESKDSDQGLSTGRKYVALHLGQIEKGKCLLCKRLHSDMFFFISLEAIPSQQKEVQIFIPQTRYTQKKIQDDRIRQLTIYVKNVFTKGFAVSWISSGATLFPQNLVGARLDFPNCVRSCIAHSGVQKSKCSFGLLGGFRLADLFSIFGYINSCWY
jgi:hypothetical protein